jgi:AmmeMemoRadiSam system protein B/AmmeMemoRadiSam system protein A
MNTVRAPAVAGLFYPEGAKALTAAVARYLADAPVPDAPPPKAVIVPHAGYIYSAPIAAPAYARLKHAAPAIERVVMLGPCHRVPVRGLAAPTVSAFRTPLGTIPLDQAAIDDIAALPQVERRDDAHAGEHCLEVQLPFLQAVLGRFTLVPLVVGSTAPEAVSEVLERLWGGPETLIVISSDLSHYHDYRTAQRMDTAAAEAIEALDGARLDQDQACGRLPIAGLLESARRHGLVAERLDLRNSGDTAGPRDQVVGYGAWAFAEQATNRTDTDDTEDETRTGRDNDRLLRAAAAALRYGVRYGREPRIDPEKAPPALRNPAATFVTLKRNGRLRGCVGSVAPVQSLFADVLQNTYGAAFRDGRFPALTRDELADLRVSISVLSPFSTLPFDDEADLIRKLRPGTDGLLLKNGGKRGLFLPQVWAQLEDPADFLDHLKDKAGINRPLHPASDRASRFTVESLGDRAVAPFKGNSA